MTTAVRMPAAERRQALIDTAIRYWSSYPDEIDAWIADVVVVEAEALSAWERQQDLLST